MDQEIVRVNLGDQGIFNVPVIGSQTALFILNEAQKKTNMTLVKPGTTAPAETVYLRTSDGTQSQLTDLNVEIEAGSTLIVNAKHRNA